MRRLAFALAIGLLASVGALGTPVQRAAAAAPQAKVVIVVGAVEGTTSSYRSYADSTAATFSKYTSNIVKVYSPNATWAAVQAAAQGASVFVYLGHGSGYPNPYVSYLQPDGDNGMGLNATSGNGDSNLKYYGENYMATLSLAPNALVLLNHLCYASGNNEPGRGNPTLSVAQTRVDGYASGFLRGNARAVIAEGLGSLSPYVDALFSTHQTIDQMWKSYPDFNNNVTAWASTRNSGYTSEIDLNLSHPQGDGDVYYRSMVSAPGLATDDVGAVVAPAPPPVSSGATYHPLAPARLLDTRAGNGLSGKLSANRPATFQVTGRGGVPTGATGVTGNLTVTGSSAGWAVYLGPDPVASPTSSTINFKAGDTLANGLTVALSATGSLSATYISTAGKTTDLVFDVTGYFTPDAAGATYHPLAPARLLDTRSGNGLSGKLSANTPATFQVTGRGGVPTGATGVTGNLTVTGSSAGWAIYLGPDANPSPTSSTINFKAGDTLANGLTVALSATGSLSATYISTAGKTTDLVFDVTGYFTPDAAGATYHPLAPARLLDTRSGNGLSGKLSANTPRTFAVSGRGGVPAGATAVTGNLTVTGSSAGWAIYLGPDPVASPTSSTINFKAGDTLANGLTVALSATGSLSATYMSTAGNTTDLVFDVTGYFTP